MTRGVFVLTAVMLALLGASSSALADGKVFLQAKAYATIPDQSALIAWRDGVQTLAIETRFIGEGAPGAWVVPLPAEPISIEPATTGMFPTLRETVTPEIDNELQPQVLALLAWLLAFVWAARLGWKRKPLFLLAIALITLIVLSALFPALSKPRGFGGSDTVTVIDRRIVGAYDTAVLRGTDERALLEWLDANGFACDPAVAPVAADYIREGWVFVAARLLADSEQTGSRPRTPHPLMFRFPTDKPVYPLRLTGVNNGDLTVDLFVFGDQQARVPGWTTVQSRPVERKPVEPFRSVRSERGEFPLVHEGLIAVVGDAEWLTRLRATLRPEQMEHDAFIEWRTPRPSGLVALSPRAAYGRAAAVALAVSAAVSLALFATGRKPTRRLAMWAAGIGLASAGAVFASDPPAPSVERYHPIRAAMGARSVQDAVWHELLERRERSSSFQPDESWARRTALAYIFGDSPLGEPSENARTRREQDSPGQFLIRTNAEGVAEFVRFGPYGEAWAEPIRP